MGKNTKHNEYFLVRYSEYPKQVERSGEFRASKKGEQERVIWGLWLYLTQEHLSVPQ